MHIHGTVTDLSPCQSHLICRKFSAIDSGLLADMVDSGMKAELDSILHGKVKIILRFSLSLTDACAVYISMAVDALYK